MLFSINCHKTRTRLITLANHKGNRLYKKNNQNSKWLHVANAKYKKTCTNESQLVMALILTGWKSGARFLSQWRSIVDAKPITGTFRHSNENRSNVNLFLIIPLLGGKHCTKELWKKISFQIMTPAWFTMPHQSWEITDELIVILLL